MRSLLRSCLGSHSIAPSAARAKSKSFAYCCGCLLPDGLDDIAYVDIDNEVRGMVRSENDDDEEENESESQDFVGDEVEDENEGRTGIRHIVLVLHWHLWCCFSNLSKVSFF